MTSGPDAPKDLGLSFEAILAVPEGMVVDRDTLKPEERALVSLTDGQRNVGDLLRLTGLSGFVVMRVLRSLRERGVLVQVGTSEPVVPVAKEKEKSGATQRKSTQDLSEVIAQRVRLRTPMVPGPAKSEGGPDDKGEKGDERRKTKDRLRELIKDMPRADAKGEIKIDNNAPTVEIRRPSTDESELFPGPPEPEPTHQAPPQPTPAPASRTVIGIPAMRLPQSLPGRSKVGTDTLMGSGPPVAVSDLSAVGEPEAPTTSFRVGHYDVITRIAQGGMGSIYLCRRAGEAGFQRLYVLKAVRQHSAQTDAAIRSFRKEARIGGLITHPNVLSVIDVGSYKDQPYLILDYVDGSSLSDLLTDGENTVRPAPSVVVAIFLDVLRGLQRAHDAQDLDGRPLGLVHGDFSPHNILVGSDGAARLTDFGSAHLTALPEDQAETGSPLGKPSYMSPEQLQGEAIDLRTDIFSVGVALWTALTGQKLFTDPSYEKTVMNVLRKKIPLPSSLGAPAALDPICQRALSRTPAGRYSSAEEMAKDLLQAAVGAHLLATPHEVGRWVQQSVGDVLAERRRRVQSVAAAATAPATPGRKARGGDTVVMETLQPRVPTPAMGGMGGSSSRLKNVEEITGPVPSTDDIPDWPAPSSRLQLVLVAGLAALFAAALAAAGTYTYLHRPGLPGPTAPP